MEWRLARRALETGEGFSTVPHAALVDDKTSVSLPSVPLDTSIRAAETHNVAGISMSHSRRLSSTETGAGAKDAHSEIDLEVWQARAPA